jgi:hypothetical protein
LAEQQRESTADQGVGGDVLAAAERCFLFLSLPPLETWKVAGRERRDWQRFPQEALCATLYESSALRRAAYLEGAALGGVALFADAGEVGVKGVKLGGAAFFELGATLSCSADRTIYCCAADSLTESCKARLFGLGSGLLRTPEGLT